MTRPIIQAAVSRRPSVSMTAMSVSLAAVIMTVMTRALANASTASAVYVTWPIMAAAVAIHRFVPAASNVSAVSPMVIAAMRPPPIAS